MIGVEQIHDNLVQVGGAVLGGAPGLPKLFHGVKVWAVGEGTQDGMPPGMLGLEQELFQLSEFGFEGGDAVFEGLGDFCQLLGGHGFG